MRRLTKIMTAKDGQGGNTPKIDHSAKAGDLASE